MKTYNNNLIPRARAMRREMTIAERKFWFDCLRHLPFKFRRQRPLGKFIVDFYCAELKLIVEIDGDSHFNDVAEIYDQERTGSLNNLGYLVLRYTNAEVMGDIDAMKMDIAKHLNT